MPFNEDLENAPEMNSKRFHKRGKKDLTLIPGWQNQHQFQAKCDQI